MSKTFTLSEAQTLLPVAEALLRKAQAASARAQEVEHEMQQLAQKAFFAGGLHVDVARCARRRAERDKALEESKGTLAEIEEIGIQIKDLEQGLLDFPAVVDGRTVLLCWRLGEKEIGYWHAPEEGFAGRKPLDRRFGKVDRSRLN